tara:strand:- start:18200 stop:18391 length:192 start_codon:yes stop_codon:yes gene_type:complete
MAIGSSGRLVIEVDPELKKKIHDAVRARGLTLREWFIRQAEQDLLIVDATQARKTVAAPKQTP